MPCKARHIQCKWLSSLLIKETYVSLQENTRVRYGIQRMFDLDFKAEAEYLCKQLKAMGY